MGFSCMGLTQRRGSSAITCSATYIISRLSICLPLIRSLSLSAFSNYNQETMTSVTLSCCCTLPPRHTCFVFPTAPRPPAALPAFLSKRSQLNCTMAKPTGLKEICFAHFKYLQRAVLLSGGGWSELRCVCKMLTLL